MQNAMRIAACAQRRSIYDTRAFDRTHGTSVFREQSVVVRRVAPCITPFVFLVSLAQQLAPDLRPHT